MPAAWGSRGSLIGICLACARPSTFWTCLGCTGRAAAFAVRSLGHIGEPSADGLGNVLGRRTLAQVGRAKLIRKGTRMAPQVGFEPTTVRLTVGCSTAELLRNIFQAAVDRRFPRLEIDERCTAACCGQGALDSRSSGEVEALTYQSTHLWSRTLSTFNGPSWRGSLEFWRPRPESNRGKRICSPARNHSATWPSSPQRILDPARRAIAVSQAC